MPRTHKFDPAKAANLEGPERKQRLDPDRILGFIPLQSHHTVADIGAGVGYFTIPLAERLPNGKVYAVDIQPEMLDLLTEKLRQHPHLQNVIPVLAQETAVPLQPASLDGALMAMVVHELDEPAAYLKMLRGLLKSGGWLCIVEWKKRQSDYGPPPEHRLDENALQAMIAAADFTLTTTHDLNPDQYVLLAKAG